jgi:putative ABC transport system permease protein
MTVQSNLLKPRWRKVLADLWENKLRTLLVVASIAVGVFAVGTIVTTYAVLSEDVGLTYAARNPANIDIRTDPFYDDFVRTIERLPGGWKQKGPRTGKERPTNNAAPGKASNWWGWMIFRKPTSTC